MEPARSGAVAAAHDLRRQPVADALGPHRHAAVAGRSVELFYREVGAGIAAPVPARRLGLWVLSVRRAARRARRRLRFLIPDRTGYGRSPRVAALPARFHEAAAIEAEALLDALGIARCAIWGHSDGAVIATLILALRDPARCAAIVLEALHVDRAKPRSRAFFTMMADDPDGFGERVTSRLAADHGDDWRTLDPRRRPAWLDIAATPDDDFYDGRLARAARADAACVHGADDPRTEPGELDRRAPRGPERRRST